MLITQVMFIMMKRLKTFTILIKNNVDKTFNARPSYIRVSTSLALMENARGSIRTEKK